MTNPPQARPQQDPASSRTRTTACLTLADGSHFLGQGFGATGEVTAGLVFNTAMTGYQEAMTDPSSAGRIIAFTFPYIGNTGITPEDDESAADIVPGIVTRWMPSVPSNWRAEEGLADWMVRRGTLGIGGIDTRRLTRLLRDHGIMGACLAHDPAGNFDIPAMTEAAKAWSGYPDSVARPDRGSEWEGGEWVEGLWHWPHGFSNPDTGTDPLHVVVIDFGIKRSLLRALRQAGLRVTIMPAATPVPEIAALAPDGLFLSNGPADPGRASDGVAIVKALLGMGLPIFGVGLGHQLLALALGGTVRPLGHGHHGVNHPVRDDSTGKVAITLMNHEFAVDGSSLPAGVIQTHRNLYDDSNAGLRVEEKPVFSVQHHPQGVHDPQDDPMLFQHFIDLMQTARG